MTFFNLPPISDAFDGKGYRNNLFFFLPEHTVSRKWEKAQRERCQKAGGNAKEGHEGSENYPTSQQTTEKNGIGKAMAVKWRPVSDSLLRASVEPV